MLKKLPPKKKKLPNKVKTKNSRSEFFVYMLECKDTTLYVGSTNNLEKRIHQHNNAKNGAHYTKIRRPVVLKYSEKVKTYADSRRREAELKRLTRQEKLELLAKYAKLYLL